MGFLTSMIIDLDLMSIDTNVACNLLHYLKSYLVNTISRKKDHPEPVNAYDFYLSRGTALSVFILENIQNYDIYTLENIQI